MAEHSTSSCTCPQTCGSTSRDAFRYDQAHFGGTDETIDAGQKQVARLRCLGPLRWTWRSSGVCINALQRCFLYRRNQLGHLLSNQIGSWDLERLQSTLRTTTRCWWWTIFAGKDAMRSRPRKKPTAFEGNYPSVWLGKGFCVHTRLAGRPRRLQELGAILWHQTVSESFATS